MLIEFTEHKENGRVEKCTINTDFIVDIGSKHGNAIVETVRGTKILIESYDIVRQTILNALRREKDENRRLETLGHGL